MIHEDLIYALTGYVKSLDDARKIFSKKQGVGPTPSGFYSVEGLVLKYGCAMAVSTEWLRRGPMKMCFMNAQIRAIANNLRYCEGYALREPVPLPVIHAWCLDRSGNVVDPTWQDTKRQIRKGAPTRRAYYGIIIDTDYMLKRMEETNEHRSMIDDFPTYPLLNERGLIKKVVIPCR